MSYRLHHLNRLHRRLRRWWIFSVVSRYWAVRAWRARRDGRRKVAARNAAKIAAQNSAVWHNATAPWELESW